MQFEDGPKKCTSEYHYLCEGSFVLAITRQHLLGQLQWFRFSKTKQPLLSANTNLCHEWDESQSVLWRWNIAVIKYRTSNNGLLGKGEKCPPSSFNQSWSRSFKSVLCILAGSMSNTIPRYNSNPGGTACFSWSPRRSPVYTQAPSQQQQLQYKSSCVVDIST